MFSARGLRGVVGRLLRRLLDRYSVITGAEPPGLDEHFQIKVDDLPWASRVNQVLQSLAVVPQVWRDRRAERARRRLFRRAEPAEREQPAPLFDSLRLEQRIVMDHNAVRRRCRIE